MAKTILVSVVTSLFVITVYSLVTGSFRTGGVDLCSADDVLNSRRTDCAVSAKQVVDLVSNFSAVRVRQLQDTHYFVDSAIGNDSGNCSQTTPCRTIQRAIDHIQNDVDRAGFRSIVNVQTNGGPCQASFEGVSLVGPGVGGNSALQPHDLELVTNYNGIFLRGNDDDPRQCVIVGDNIDAIYVEGGGTNFEVSGFSLSATGGAGFGIHATIGAKILISGPMDFGDTPPGFSQIYADFGGVLLIYETEYTVSGDAPWHMLAEDGGKIFHGNTVARAIGNRSFYTAVVSADDNAVIRSTGSTFPGEWTGRRYWFTSSAVGQTFGGGEDYFPGTLPGVLESGGQFQ